MSRKRQRTATPERQDQHQQLAGALSGEASGGRGVDEVGVEPQKAAAEPVQVGSRKVQACRSWLCWSMFSQSACFSAEGMQVLSSSRAEKACTRNHEPC